jgi:hypothetical protein
MTRKREPACKPGSVSAARTRPTTVIPLRCASPHTCSNLPGDLTRAALSHPCGRTIPLFGLAPSGVYPATGVDRRGALLPHHFTLTAPLARGLAVYFLWHFPWTHVPQALPGTLPCGARTFLRRCRQRLSGRLSGGSVVTGRRSFKGFRHRRVPGQAGHGRSACG